MPEVTYTTKLPSDGNLSSFLFATSRLMCRVARQFYVDWQVLRSNPEDLIKSYQVRFGITWHQANSIHRWVKGMVDSATASHKRHIAEIEGQIKSAENAVLKWKKKVKDAAKKARRFRKPIIPNQQSQQKLRLKIHYKKRRIAHLKAKLERLKAQSRPHIIFGGKKLFKAQFYLEENGYRNLSDWFDDWDRKRHNQFLCVGKGSDRCGNRSVQWFESGRLRISVPPALRDKFGDFVETKNVLFPYGQTDLSAALKEKKALTHRLICKGNNWYLHTTIERETVKLKTKQLSGMMGIDINPDEIGWAIASEHGNPISSGSIKYNLDRKSSKQATQILALIIKEIVDIALGHGVPITVEKLDFTEQKRKLREKGFHYSSMLSSFAYSKFDELLTSRCARSGVKLLHHNPAWSSLIGMTKFMTRYGMSSATAAALVMARRGQRFSERLGARYARLLQVDGKRHVWNHWRTFRTKLVLKLPRHRFFDLDTAIASHVAKLEMEIDSAKKPRRNPASSDS